MKYSYALDVAFEFESPIEDFEVCEDNLEEIILAAKARLDRILEYKDVEAFGIYDVCEVP